MATKNQALESDTSKKTPRETAEIVLRKFLAEQKIQLRVGDMITKRVEDGSVIVTPPQNIIVTYE